MKTNIEIPKYTGCSNRNGYAFPKAMEAKLRPAAPNYAELRRKNYHLEQQIEALKRQLAVDPLTGVLNRPTFDEVLDQEWQRAVSDAVPLACVMLDIDYFKKINDTHGHAVGDHVIQAVANLLQKLGHRENHVARVGGEEFCILLPSTQESEASEWAETVRAAIASLEIPSSIKPFAVTASFGVAEHRQTMNEARRLVDAADQSLLVAKQQGRNRVVQFTSVVGSQDAAEASLFHRLTARDVMTPLLASLRPQQTLMEAANMLLLLRLDSLPVLDDDGAFVGLIGEEDLTAHSLSADGWNKRVCDIMGDTLSSFDECDPASTVCSFLSRLSIRRVVVISDGLPTGIVSRAGLIRWFSNHLVQTSSANTCQADAIGKDLEAQMAATLTLLQNQVQLLQDEHTLEGDERGDYHVGAISRIQELSVAALNLSSIQYARDLAPGMARLSELTA